MINEAVIGTKDRLLVAGIRLFAEQGFQSTTVGEIEAAAGLRPRRGALYHYFESKQALLEEAMAEHLVTIKRGREELATLPGDDITAEALTLGRWFLSEFDMRRSLTQILEKDGERLPKLRDRIRRQIVDPGHAPVEAVLQRWFANDRSLDVAALAVVLLGPLVNLRRYAWTFGRPPRGVDDERLLKSWAATWAELVAAHRRNR